MFLVFTMKLPFSGPIPNFSNIWPIPTNLISKPGFFLKWFIDTRHKYCMEILRTAISPWILPAALNGWIEIGLRRSGSLCNALKGTWQIESMSWHELTWQIGGLQITVINCPCLLQTCFDARLYSQYSEVANRACLVLEKLPWTNEQILGICLMWEQNCGWFRVRGGLGYTYVPLLYIYNMYIEICSFYQALIIFSFYCYISDISVFLHLYRFPLLLVTFDSHLQMSGAKSDYWLIAQGFNPYRSHPHLWKSPILVRGVYEKRPLFVGYHHWECLNTSLICFWIVIGDHIPHYFRRNTIDLRSHSRINQPVAGSHKQVLGTTCDTGNAFAVNRSPAAWISPTRHWRIWGASKTYMGNRQPRQMPYIDQHWWFMCSITDPAETRIFGWIPSSHGGWTGWTWNIPTRSWHGMARPLPDRPHQPRKPGSTGQSVWITNIAKAWEFREFRELWKRFGLPHQPHQPEKQYLKQLFDSAEWESKDIISEPRDIIREANMVATSSRHGGYIWNAVCASQYNHRIESKNSTCVAHVSDIAMTDKDGKSKQW